MSPAPVETFDIRLHGRGGQGVVTAAELLSIAAFGDGLEAQAFPSFGSERMGAPVASFCRISTVPIRAHEPLTAPHAVVVADATLLGSADVLAGLRPGGYVVVNSSRRPDQLELGAALAGSGPERVRTVPATDIAREYLGRPLPNVCLLGALLGLTGRVSMDALEAAVVARFPGPVGAANARAARAAFALVAEVCDA